jgi:hypothetical protein
MGGIVLTVRFGIGDEIARAGRVFEGTHQCLSPLLEHLGVCRVAIPALAHKGDTTVLRHHQFQHRLLQVRTIVLGVAVGVMQMACSSCSGSYSPVSAKLVVSR